MALNEQQYQDLLRLHDFDETEFPLEAYKQARNLFVRLTFQKIDEANIPVAAKAEVKRKIREIVPEDLINEPWLD
jgi:hypothetical protein